MAEMTISFECGFLIRRKVRFLIASHRLKAKEFRGILESGFVVEGNYEPMNVFKDDLFRLLERTKKAATY